MDYPSDVVTAQRYTQRESTGVGFLVGAGALSLVSVIGLLLLMLLSMLSSLKASDSSKMFIRTHAAVFFVSLLVCDFMQAIGSLLNLPWMSQRVVYVGQLCTAQAAIKQTGNVGTALWSFVIACHTFSLLFLRRKWTTSTTYIVFIGTWIFLGIIVCLGPLVIRTNVKGPFYGVSGYWCWITPAYPVERYALEYLFMFASAGLSFILYSLVFLRLRENIVINYTAPVWYKRYSFQRRPRVRITRASNGVFSISTDDKRVESYLTTIAKQMMWYPVAYTILILPIACARFSTFSGKSVPFEVTIGTATVFMLSGFVNAVLFITTRNILPGTWKQRFGLGTAIGSSTAAANGGTGGATHSIRTWGEGREGVPMSRIGAVSGIGIEKHVEVKFETRDIEEGDYIMETSASPMSTFKYKGPFQSPSSPSSPRTVGKRVIDESEDSYANHLRQISQPRIPPPVVTITTPSAPRRPSTTINWDPAAVNHPQHLRGPLDRGGAPGLEAYQSNRMSTMSDDTLAGSSKQPQRYESFVPSDSDSLDEQKNGRFFVGGRR